MCPDLTRCADAALIERKQPSPDDVLNGDVDFYVWHPDGWECGTLGSVSDARKHTRGQAAAFFANEAGERFSDVRTWKRYVCALTRQYAWDEGGRDRYEDQHDLDFDTAPERVPDDWEADPDDDPVWVLVRRDHPDAIPVWICGEKGSRPPHAPRR